LNKSKIFRSLTEAQEKGFLHGIAGRLGNLGAIEK